MSTFKLPRMDKHEIQQLLREQFLCRIAFKGNKYPYMAPFQYVFIDGSLYFHFTDYGRKMKLLEEDKHVCVEIEKYKQDVSAYNFAVFMGELKVVTDPLERAKVIRKMAEDGRQKLSTNFLAAHGLKDEDWSSFTPEKPLIIVKLENVAKEIGLKSPQSGNRRMTMSCGHNL